MPNPNEQANPLFHALTMMLQQQARPSSTYVDAPYVAQQQQKRQASSFEQAKQEDYFNKVRELNALRAQGTNPSQMFQKANNFVGDFVTGNNTQQMMENVAMNAVPIGKLLSAIAPLAGKGFNAIKRELPIDNFTKDLAEHKVDKIYREMNLDNAFSFIDPRTSDGYMKQTEYYFADHPDLAIGQGKNKGVIVELNAGGLQGRPDFSKPVSKQMYQDGMGEYKVKYNSQKDYLNNLNAVTVKPDLQVNGLGEKKRLQNLLKSMEASGFTKTTNEDGSITWRRR